MRSIITIFILVYAVFAGPFDGDDTEYSSDTNWTSAAFADPFDENNTVFPPDPEWTDEDFKMQPIVSHTSQNSGSGSKNQTSATSQDRTKPVIQPANSSASGDREWSKASDNKRIEEYIVR